MRDPGSVMWTISIMHLPLCKATIAQCREIYDLNQMWVNLFNSFHYMTSVIKDARKINKSTYTTHKWHLHCRQNKNKNKTKDQSPYSHSVTRKKYWICLLKDHSLSHLARAESHPHSSPSLNHRAVKQPPPESKCQQPRTNSEANSGIRIFG